MKESMPPQAEPRESEDPADQPRNVGRPSVALPYAPVVRVILESEPDIPTAEILRRLRSRGYARGKTALYHLVAVLRHRLDDQGVRTGERLR